MSERQYDLIAALSRELMGEGEITGYAAPTLPTSPESVDRTTGPGDSPVLDEHPQEVRGTDAVRVEIIDLQSHVEVGQPAYLVAEVTSVGDVIGLFQVSLVGIDGRHVTVDPPFVDLFPGERKRVTVGITLPSDHPAGRRRLALEVADTKAEKGTPSVTNFAIEVQGEPSLTVAVEPSSMEIGAAGVFIIHVVNTGNTPLDVDLSAQDAERLVEVTFEPARPRLQPGERAVVSARVRGPRHWLGLPEVRVLDVVAEADGASALGVMALFQKPRISRKLVSLLGLLFVIAVFALVIAYSFGEVAKLNKANEQLVQQGLGVDDAAAARVAAQPVAGQVSNDLGEPIRSATVRLFKEGNPDRAAQTTVTDADGAFTLPAVTDGSYLLRADAAGYGARWFGGDGSLEGAETLKIEDGEAQGLEGPVAFVLSGQRGSVSGTVVGTEVEGALVQLFLPESAIEPFDPADVRGSAKVAEVEVDATGQFVLVDLITPGTYELVVSKDGFKDGVTTVELKPGAQAESIEVLLARGLGTISGKIFVGAGDAGGSRDPDGQAILADVEILATDGTTQWSTRSSPEGAYELVELAAGSPYSVTFSRDGYFPVTRTILAEDPLATVVTDIVMFSDKRSLSGHVRGADGTAIGGVTVMVVGGDINVETKTLTIGDEGQWFVDNIPVPGAYTVSFRKDGYETAARAIELTAAGGSRTDIDAVLTRATASVRGVVKALVADESQPDDAPTAQPVGGVQITMERSGFVRTTTSSDAPSEGQYGFDNVPVGVYTLTFERTGSSPQTLLYEVTSGAANNVPEVVLEQQASITGLVHRNNVAASDVGVLIYRSRDYPGGLVAETVTDEQGRFSFIGLEAPDGYVIDFHYPAGGPVARSKEVFLQPGDQEDLGTVNV